MVDDADSVTDPRILVPPVEPLQSLPDTIPRLPVLGWESFAGRESFPADTLFAAPNLVFTTSGRAAIWLALQQLGIGPGDRVLVPTYHCPTMVAPAIHAGAEPIFYPVTCEGVDTPFLGRLDSRHVRALIVAHFFGRPIRMSAVREFCDSRGIALIEDCAHALFGVTDGKPVGAWGDFAIGSLTKFLPVPEAGCLASWRRPMNLRLVHQPARAELKCAIDILEVGARHKRLLGLNTILSSVFGLKNAIRRRRRPAPAAGAVPEGTANIDNDFDTRYASAAPTRVSRLVVASVGWRRIRERRRRNYATLAQAFDACPGFHVLYPDLPERAAPYVLPIWVKDPEPKYQALRAAGCPVFRWEWLWPGTPLLSGDEGLAWSRHVFQLPCHQDLTERDLEWLVTTVRRVLAAPDAERAPSPAPLQRQSRPKAKAPAATVRRVRHVKTVLLVAFHFPPLAGTSGIQRTLSFVRDLPSFGWRPIVLTAHPRAYERTTSDQLGDIPEGVVVERAFALDSARQLAIVGRYPALIARPDRWMSWWFGAVPSGLRLVRRYRVDVIWSTYPIATAHMVGHTVARASGLPWVADFRDPMAQPGYPADPKTWRKFRQIEDAAIPHAAFSTFTSPGAIRFYRERFPDVAAEKFVLIENGYDEEIFQEVEAAASPAVRRPANRVVLLHSGVVYPSERNPAAFFAALRRLLESGEIREEDFLLAFRATGHDAFVAGLVERHGLGRVVELRPTIPYRDALEEMLAVDGLVVIQLPNCNDQIPAKLYEYVRAQRPVLGLTDPNGDTAATMRRHGLSSIAHPQSVEDIARVFPLFLESVRRGTAGVPPPESARRASRAARAEELAALLDRAGSERVPMVAA